MPRPLLHKPRRQLPTKRGRSNDLDGNRRSQRLQAAVIPHSHHDESLVTVSCEGEETAVSLLADPPAEDGSPTPRPQDAILDEALTSVTKTTVDAKSCDALSKIIRLSNGLHSCHENLLEWSLNQEVSCSRLLAMTLLGPEHEGRLASICESDIVTAMSPASVSMSAWLHSFARVEFSQLRNLQNTNECFGSILGEVSQADGLLAHTARSAARLVCLCFPDSELKVEDSDEEGVRSIKTPNVWVAFLRNPSSHYTYFPAPFYTPSNLFATMKAASDYLPQLRERRESARRCSRFHFTASEVVKFKATVAEARYGTCEYRRAETKVVRENQ